MKKPFLSLHLIVSLILLIPLVAFSQRGKRNKSRSTTVSATKSIMNDTTFMGLKFRNLGPAFMSGRIADIAIHPKNDNIWYVAVGSGGVWKTVNAGTTWTPIFDDQSSYSIGCVTIDDNNPHNIWVGTGENIGGRHSGFGDGVYLSKDGGKSWKNMGLKNSEHISKIIIHPENSNVIWVASQGPLWSKGGERGLYKSTDGGKSWNRTLGDSEWVGVTDILIDPKNPNQLYAATWQRHRNVAAYMGSGPGTAIYRSNDGGDNWEKLSVGLPTSNMGKIGLALAPENPDVIYAAIELERRTGGVYRSIDKGSTWEKRSNAVAGATGPHYYQELYASPHQPGRLYLVDNWMQVSEDGGKTFTRLNNQHKHGDNHAIAFKKDDPNYLIVGTDGGIYESFDLAKNWKFIDNLPVTQYYKLALDDAEPFYNIYGGTQDNSTQGGPSRTDNVHGIQNSDWKIVLNWDGHQPATEPGNPNIMYAERQEGTLSRIDLVTGEVVDIQPQPSENENFERFNWDAPILVSPHSSTRLYFASQRVWKSDNRGDEWTAISGDLTKNQDRIELPIMGKKQSWDEAWDFLAMSNYNTITSISESPKKEGLLYIGTDDGIIQVTEDGGSNWRKINVGSIQGIPSTAFVNDIKADLHDENTVYVALDNHKYGDFKPYLIKSNDKGNTWKSINNNLTDKNLVWRIVQDHVKPELMFLATEFGIYFTINNGNSWTELQGGIPTISFRDIAIQKRENDLVCASFGRGFYVLDDYSALRNVSEQQLSEEATLFASRKAWWYVPRPHLSFDDQKGSQGASHYVAPNPDYGAVFTYYLKDGYKSLKETRKEKEKSLKNSDVQFPGWEAMENESNESAPVVWITIKDINGNVIRRVKGATKKGFNRVAWDLRYPAPDAINLEAGHSDFHFTPQGLMAAPGKYTASLSKQINGVVTPLSKPIEFEVVPLRKGALEGKGINETTAFWRSYEKANKNASALQLSISNYMTRIKGMETALNRSQSEPGKLDADLHNIRKSLIALNKKIYGSGAKRQVGEKTKPTIGDRMFSLYIGIGRSTYGPTATHKKTLEIINSQIKSYSSELNNLKNQINTLSKSMQAAGAPWVESDILPED